MRVVYVFAVLPIVIGGVCPSQESFNVSALTCGEVISFLTYHSERVVSRFNESPRPLMLAFVHLVGTFSNLRSECVTESFRFISMLLIRDALPLLQSGNQLEDFPIARFHENLKKLPILEVAAPYYSHEHDGRLTSLEALRMRTFNEQPLCHICVLRYAINELFQEGDTVLELGSGPGAVHSVWLNQTGLVKSVAVDNFPETSFVTNNNVLEVDFKNKSELENLRFLHADWILGLGLDIEPEMVIDSLRPNKGLIFSSITASVTLADTRVSFELNAACNSSSHHYYIKLTL